MKQLQRAMSVWFPSALAVVFWVVDSVAVGRRLAEPGMMRAFFWNALLIGVVITSVNAATVAWMASRTGADAGASRRYGRLALGSILTAFASALLGLGCGIGITAVIVTPTMNSHLWGLFSQGLRLVVPLGGAFSLVGAVAGDLGSNLRALLQAKPAVKMARGLVVLLVAAHLLWAGLAWLALVSVRDLMPGT